MSVTDVQLSEARSFAVRAAEDFEFFAATCLRIRDKDGNVVPFRLNRCQRFLHKRVEAMLKKTGRVRVVVVKSRQQGSSTYIQGRFYWNLWRSGKALRAFILTHDDDATSNLFGMAQRFQELMPAHMRPQTKAASAKEMIFAANDCGYQVATAGGKNIGRSYTIQLLHGSEVPSWPNAAEHMQSLVGTALSKGAGSECFLEATAKGVGNVFYNEAMAAARGKSEYELIFTPWYWSEDYETRCPKSFTETVSEAWREYARIHELTWEQLYWVYNKNAELARPRSLDIEKPCWVLAEEYPATYEEAFQTSGDSFIPSTSVMRARRPEEPIIGRGPIIIGIDPARDRDSVGIIDRCGRRMGERINVAWPPEGDTVYLAQKIATQVIDLLKPDAVNIDIGGNGVGVYDQLCAMGYEDILNPVNFGSSPVGKGPTGDRMYADRRAEMYDLLRDWFEEPGGVQIPDDDNLHQDLTAAVWGSSGCRYNTSNALVIEQKDKIKERLNRSPDRADSAALTFAVPFAPGFLARDTPLRERGVRRRRGGY